MEQKNDTQSAEWESKEQKWEFTGKRMWQGGGGGMGFREDAGDAGGCKR